MLINRGRKALTLIELIVVIVIVGILAAIAAVGFQTVIDRTNESAIEQAASQFDKEYRALLAFEAGSSTPRAATALVADVAADFSGATLVGDGSAGSVCVHANGYEATLTLATNAQTAGAIAVDEGNCA
jgi:prepilin-type N-terminal cleavage/methylation domain-containing protein